MIAVMLNVSPGDCLGQGCCAGGPVFVLKRGVLGPTLDFFHPKGKKFCPQVTFENMLCPLSFFLKFLLFPVLLALLHVGNFLFVPTFYDSFLESVSKIFGP